MIPYVTEWPVKIGSYGVMIAVGFLTGLWLLSRDFRRRNIDPKHAETTVFVAIIFGVLGAKLAYMFTETDNPTWGDFFSGSGLTWHGGLILAALAVIAYYIAKRLPLLVMLDAVSPGLATGYGFGRVGCQLSGDGDYGIPCSVTDIDYSLCMSYDRGIVPTSDIVHPTPVYETFMNFVLFAILWKLRKRIRHPGILFGVYLIGSGFARFGIEFIRQEEGRPYRFWGLRDAHLVALGQVVVGLGFCAVALLRKLPKDQEYGILPAPVAATNAAGRPRKR